ncbi:helix-turn-helix transcriptional regulator [Actinoplanes sp. NPDC000266]
MGLTQQQVADELIKIAWAHRKLRVGVDRQMVSKWEREKKHPDATYRELLCLLYGASEESLGFRIPAQQAVMLSAGLLLPTDMQQLESPIEIVERIQDILSTKVSDESIDRLDEILNIVVQSYESSGPDFLAARVVKQRKMVADLLSGPVLPRQRDRLYVIASKLSALLGYMAVNLGKFPIAEAYNEEAFALAEITGATDMQAWVRGTESFCAYYKQDYQRAVDLARDGMRYADNGPQAVRLAINGEARALGKLGDEAGVSRAVDLAYQITDRFDTVPGVSSCISLGIYSQARTAANAATAFVSLGMPDRVTEFSQQVTPAMEASDSCWTQSLVRLDIATAMIMAKAPEPEQAAQLVQEALTISAERPITSVLARSQEFLVAADRWRKLPAMIETVQTLRMATTR